MLATCVAGSRDRFRPVRALAVKILLLMLLIACLGCFSWARRKFFHDGASKHRNGLAPLGPIFGVLMAVVIAIRVPMSTFSLSEVFASLLFLGSLWLFWASVRAFGDRRPAIAFSPGAPSSLVVSGPYRYLRHPFYTAYLLCWSGCFFSSPEVMTVIPFFIMGWLYYKAASNEESSIRESSLGSDYEEYSRGAGMFFPRLWKK